MTRDTNFIVKVSFAALGLLLVAYFLVSRSDVKHYEWKESYRANSDQPYGTHYIQRLLAGLTPGQTFTINEKEPLHVVLDSQKVKQKTNYVFIGHDIYIDDQDREALLKFIAAGNDAFIATVSLPTDLITPMFTAECEEDLTLVSSTAPKATMDFYNSSLKTPDNKGYVYAYRFGKQDQSYFWNSINSGIFCDSTRRVTPLGFIDPDHVNFFMLSHGKGHLYIHVNPLVFTNYFMIHADKLKYAANVFSHLDGSAVIWDEFSKSPFAYQNNAPQVSPMAYVLQQDSLRYAWWLLLASALLYLVFTAKRKQRVIPVLEEKVNTSLEFVNMLSSLHFQNGNHRDIAKRKIKYFHYFVRAKYNLQLQSLNDLYIRRLAEKSKVSADDVKKVADEITVVEKQPYYEVDMLVDLHNSLENFYKQCK